MFLFNTKYTIINISSIQSNNIPLLQAASSRFNRSTEEECTHVVPGAIETRVLVLENPPGPNDHLGVANYGEGCTRRHPINKLFEINTLMFVYRIDFQ